MPIDVVDKIRKILALAESENEHEADNARKRAEALMAAEGLTAADIAPKEEEETIWFDHTRIYAREELAFAVAKSRGCKAGSGVRGISIKGPKTAAKNAAHLYQVLARDAQKMAAKSAVGAGGKEVQEAWVTAYWLGFVAAVENILSVGASPEVVLSVEVVRPEDLAARREKAAVGLAGTVDRLASGLVGMVEPDQVAEMAMKFLKRAFAAGRLAGASVDLPAWSPPKRAVKGHLAAG